MVKTLRTLISPCPKACYLIQKVDPAINFSLTTNSPVLIIIEPSNNHISNNHIISVVWGWYRK